ncbi:MAG: hypothetical protein AAF636_14455 [Pseudomonadota bacterium]
MPRGALRRAFDAPEREEVIWHHVGKDTFAAREGQDVSNPPVDRAGDVIRQLSRPDWEGALGRKDVSYPVKRPPRG